MQCNINNTSRDTPYLLAYIIILVLDAASIHHPLHGSIVLVIVLFLLVLLVLMLWLYSAPHASAPQSAKINRMAISWCCGLRKQQQRALYMFFFMFYTNHFVRTERHFSHTQTAYSILVWYSLLYCYFCTCCEIWRTTGESFTMSHGEHKFEIESESKESNLNLSVNHSIRETSRQKQNITIHQKRTETTR